METPDNPNPYQAVSSSPQPGVDLAPNDGYIRGGQTVSAGSGAEWVATAWQLFVKEPVMWILMVVLYAIFYLALAFVPFVGSIAGYLLHGIIGAGWLASANAVAKGEKLEVDYLFSGFKSQTSPLFTLGALYTGGSIAILILMVLIAIFIALAMGASGAIGALMSKDWSDLAPYATALFAAFMFVVLIGLSLLLPLVMALWFAPALVYFHDEPPVAALKISFFACLKNWLPFTVYSIVMLMLMVVAALPLMLGFLVVGPIALISVYASYRSVFTQGLPT
jgi:uncharacterized membrane protein